MKRLQMSYLRTFEISFRNDEISDSIESLAVHTPIEWKPIISRP